MPAYIVIFLVALISASCASSQNPRSLDAKADEELGLGQEARILEAQETLQTIQDRARQEQKNALQRQITETNF